jgi:hypothetical protein
MARARHGFPCREGPAPSGSAAFEGCGTRVSSDNCMYSTYRPYLRSVITLLFDYDAFIAITPCRASCYATRQRTPYAAGGLLCTEGKRSG